MEMEKEEKKVEQAEVKEQEEEEETALIARKSRTGYESKTTEIAAAAAADVELREGVPESNGHAIQSELAEKEELITLENEQKPEKLNGVRENVAEAINGEQKPQNLVFYDNGEGIWKCRLCPWTYRNGSVCVDYIQSHKAQLHRLMNLKLLNFESKVSGVESESTFFEEKQILKDPGPQRFDISSLDFAFQNNSTSATNNRYNGEIENNNISSSNLQPSQISAEEGITSYESSKEIESTEDDLINVDDLEVTEQDVERVIQKQTTHDLYCPNCNSCITKRVVLRKRKRRVRISDEVKRNRTETALDSKLATGLVQSPSNQVDDGDQITAANEDERERGPFIFRCLSCFSFFIPTEDGFSRIFGVKGGKDSVQDQQALSTKKNWFTSMFTSNKPETTVVEQGAVIPSSDLSNQSGQPSLLQKTPTPTQEGEDNNLQFPKQKLNGNVAAGVGGELDTKATQTAGSWDAVITFSTLSEQSGQSTFSQTTRTPAQEGGDKISPFPNQKPSINGKVAVGTGDKLDTKATETVDATMELFDSYTKDELRESKSGQVLNGNHKNDLSVTTHHTMTQDTNGKSTEDAFSFSQEGGLKFLISENNGSSTLENSDEVQSSKQTVQPGAADKEVIELPPSSAPGFKASDADGKWNISVSIPHQEQDVRATILTDSVLENTYANFSSSDHGHVNHTEVSQHITTKTEIEFHSSEPQIVGSVSAPSNAAFAQGKDTVITINQLPAEPSQTLQDEICPSETAGVSQPATQSGGVDSDRTVARKENQIEVVKSIVYGGLAESITSLSVVSSAVGGGAATLNVLALGAANLFGGLFIIFHNLWDLKCDGAEQVSNQIVEQRDLYKEVLGRRQNFILHAIVVVISYIIFGLVPPIVYGFSFRKSDDKQLKLVVVGAASLACILGLAIAKAYTQRSPKPYLKTMTKYLVLGFMVSGVSYAAGRLVERLLNELGLFQTGSVPNLVVQEMRPTGFGWAAY